jgi:hypothetical protein
LVCVWREIYIEADRARLLSGNLLYQVVQFIPACEVVFSIAWSTDHFHIGYIHDYDLQRLRIRLIWGEAKLQEVVNRLFDPLKSWERFKNKPFDSKQNDQEDQPLGDVSKNVSFRFSFPGGEVDVGARDRALCPFFASFFTTLLFHAVCFPLPMFRWSST